MPSDPKTIEFDIAVLEQLACPVCLGILRLDTAGLVCTACGRVYPIVDGIPVLIGEAAAPAPNSASLTRK